MHSLSFTLFALAPTVLVSSGTESEHLTGVLEIKSQCHGTKTLTELGEPRKYTAFQKDLEFYRKHFETYAPRVDSATGRSVALLLPVSYYFHPSNFARHIAAGLCKSARMSNLSRYWKFCAFPGRRGSDTRGNGTSCQADIREAFLGSDRSSAPADSRLKVSAYFTWYSGELNQPVLSGYWSRPVLRDQLPGDDPCTPGARGADGADAPDRVPHLKSSSKEHSKPRNNPCS